MEGKRVKREGGKEREGEREEGRKRKETPETTTRDLISMESPKVRQTKS